MGNVGLNNSRGYSGPHRNGVEDHASTVEKRTV